MTHNPLSWKIYAADGTFSVYCDRPAEGYWFRDFADADQFRRALADDPNLDPLTVFTNWKPANS